MIETIVIIMFLSILFIFLKTHSAEVSFVESFDNNSYLVRNLPDKKEASNLLGEIRSRLIKLAYHCYDITKNGGDKEYIDYIKSIYNKIESVEMRESSANNKYTSYSINKGEEIVFCLRSKIDNKLHDINRIMYVAIHEVAHIGCPEIDHTPLFNKINKYLLRRGIDINIYKYNDYGINPVEYCGITLNNNILSS